LEKDEISEKITYKKDRLVEEIKTLNNKLHWFSVAYREHKISVSEKNELLNNISVSDFWKYLEEQYHKINDEELYKYKEKFEKEFRDTLFIRLTDFYNILENEADKILEKINIINKTLKTINYSKDTYIEVSLKNNTKKWDWIEEFKKDFREKVIYKKELDIIDKVKAFEDIKSLMEKLLDKTNENWRNNMIDVRNWFLFNIKEIYRNDETLKDIYESSSWKSWWQTIKLAYSVLASAILYQYGIREDAENLLNNNLSKSFRLVVVVKYFMLNPKNNLYIRELPLKVHTKFIENNKKIIDTLLQYIDENNDNSFWFIWKTFEEKYWLKVKPEFIRFRYLDKNHRQNYLWKDADDIYFKVEDFCNLNFNCKNIFIVENEINYLTFPQIENSIIIWGKWFNISLLKNIDWLNVKEIYYWWDIDSHWFKILAQCRKYYNHTKSIFMDEFTYVIFHDFIVEWKILWNEESINMQKYLSEEEYKLFYYINCNRIRLEQENINQEYLLKKLVDYL